MQINARKDIRGNWIAESKFNLGNDYVLSFATRKVSSGAVLTTASVSKYENGFMTHVVYQDYHKALDSQRYGRVTAKAVESQQLHAIRNSFDSVMSDVMQQYQGINRIIID